MTSNGFGLPSNSNWIPSSQQQPNVVSSYSPYPYPGPTTTTFQNPSQIPALTSITPAIAAHDGDEEEGELSEGEFEDGGVQQSKRIARDDRSEGEFPSLPAQIHQYIPPPAAISSRQNQTPMAPAVGKHNSPAFRQQH